MEERAHSLIIQKIAKHIENDEQITYEWNEEDNSNLNLILLKIYKDNVVDIDEFDRSMFLVNAYIEKIIGIATDLNKTMRKSINIDNLRKLLKNESVLRQTALNNITTKDLEEKAKKYGIKPHHAIKIFNKLKLHSAQQYDNDDDVKKDDDDKKDDNDDFNLHAEQQREGSPPGFPVMQQSLSLDLSVC